MLRLASFALLVVGSVATPLETALWLLRVGEELHRTFKTERNVEILEATGTDGYLCAKRLQSSIVSRKIYEDSWTGVNVAGSLQAVFNLTCFAQSPDACLDYLECQDLNQRYPTVPNNFGQTLFSPETTTLRGLRWASTSALVEAWEKEVTALQAQLVLDPDDASEKSQFLRDAIRAAAASAGAGLTTGSDALLAMALERLAEYKLSVRSATAPAPATGSAILPASLEALAVAVESLAAAAAGTPCSGSVDWASLQQGVLDNLGAQSGAINHLDASGLLQLADFDYARRAVEALAVGTALSMQVGAVAALVEFGCELDTAPRTAAVRDLETLRAADHALLTQVSTALPTPADGTVPSAPMQLCFADRVFGAVSAISTQAAAEEGPARDLLSLDFCGRLFDAITSVVIQVAPGSEAPPTPSSTVLISSLGEERIVYAGPNATIAYIDPFVVIIDRGAYDSSGWFADNDKVIQLKRIITDNVQAAAATPVPNYCTAEETAALAAAPEPQCDGWNYTNPPCTVSGCYRVSGFCFPAGAGFYVEDGLTEKLCPMGDLQPHETIFYAKGWPDSNCPFLCVEADRVRSGLTCQTVVDGYYSPTCSNENLACAVPDGLTDELFCSVARFTSPGQGKPDGCEVRLAAPLAMRGAQEILMPPMTVELWLNIQVADIPSSYGILMGTFPQWFLALRRVSSTALQIGFYHHHVTRAVSSRDDSIVWSQPVEWSTEWRHIAVVASSTDATTPNIHFYSNGELISSAQRSAATVPFAQVHPCQLHTFHVGPPNAQLSPEVLSEGRTEPYPGVTGGDLFFVVQIDEVRVSRAALDGITQGFRLTELRRKAACDMVNERLDGSTCRPSARVTPLHSGPDGCDTGYEMCGSRPGMCVAECTMGTLRQPDCTCDCPPGTFQTWHAQAVHITGSGTVGNISVYDIAHNIITSVSSADLPHRISISPAREVSVVTIRSIASALTVSLDVETAAGERVPVPAYRNIPLETGRETIFHHRRLHEFNDPSLSCATCPGDFGVVLGSNLPRTDSLSCLCTAGNGRNLLGRCTPLKEPLPPPTISLPSGFHDAGTLVRLLKPAFFGEGEWLLKVHYNLGTHDLSTPTPTCTSAQQYTEDATTPGLDIIRREEQVAVCAVACHPSHQGSAPVCAVYNGNEHMNPPRCIINGTMSRDTTYDRQAVIEFVVDGHPGATIHYRLAGSQQTQTYSGPIMTTNPGVTELEAYCEQPGFSRSAVSTCRFEVDAAPRLALSLAWPEGVPSQVGGTSHGDGAAPALMVKRSVSTLTFKLEEQNPGGGAAPQSVEIEYHLARGSEQFGNWFPVAVGGFVNLSVQENLQAPNTNTILSVEWRVRELGYVWSSPAGTNFLLVAAQTGQPTIEMTCQVPLAVGDSWFSPTRAGALLQVHLIVLHPPTAGARLLIKLGPWASTGPLLTINEADVSSLRNNGLLEQFRIRAPSPDWGPDEHLAQCGPDLASADLPMFCEYLGPFEVVGGTQVTVFAIEQGQLESLATQNSVPLLVEPPADDSRFVADATIQGPRVAISSTPGLFVLPSSATALEISVNPTGVDRQSCVIVSPFAYTTTQQQVPQQVTDCTWLAYNGMRRLQLTQLVQQAGIAADSDTSLNITVMTTLQRPGYLWSFPSTTTYIWLRERTPPPSIVGVIEPGNVGLVSAMVWLRGETPSGASTLPASSTDRARCFFSLRSIPVTDAELPANWLVEVPARTLNVPTVPDAVLPTQDPAVRGIEEWRDNIRLCTWPNVCELPLNGTLPEALIQAPADLPRLCTWALWHGYRASLTACELMGPAAPVKEVVVDFAPGDHLTDEQLAGSSGLITNVVKVGYDDTLKAPVVMFQASAPEAGSNSTSRRLVDDGYLVAQGLPLFLERTHPLQYRFASVCFGVQNISLGADQLLGSEAFSQWTSLDLADPTPMVPLPAHCQSHEHMLAAVDVRLLIGIERWGQQSRSYCVVLQGIHPSPVVHKNRRSISAAGPFADSTFIFRWSPGGAEDLKALGGGTVLQMQPNFNSISSAIQLHSSVRLMPAGTPPDQCLAPEGSELEAEKTGVVGPRLCSAAGPLELHAPGSGRWTLWIAVYGPGLRFLPAVTATVEAQCQVPANIQHASTPACLEGDMIDSGTTCTSSCVAGYAPSSSSMTCSDGSSNSVAFTCEEAPCTIPSVANMSLIAPCLEGSVVPSGGTCTPQCLHGFAASAASLSCVKGTLSPSVFTCMDAPCAAPGDVVHASSPSCSGMATIASGEKCVPQCQEGYQANETELMCSRGSFSLKTFTCEQADCPAPSGVAYAAAPACAEGDRIAAGTSCTPSCQHGYKASEATLACTRGEFAPVSFTCEKVGMDIAPVFAGSVGGFIAFVFMLVFFCCIQKRKNAVEEEAPVDKDQELLEAYQAWMECVNEVPPGYCVFCGAEPATEPCLESEHGPDTIYKCCQRTCTAIIPRQHASLNELGETSSAFGVSEAEPVQEKVYDQRAVEAFEEWGLDKAKSSATVLGNASDYDREETLKPQQAPTRDRQLAVGPRGQPTRQPVLVRPVEDQPAPTKRWAAAATGVDEMSESETCSEAPTSQVAEQRVPTNKSPVRRREENNRNQNNPPEAPTGQAAEQRVPASKSPVRNREENNRNQNNPPQASNARPRNQGRAAANPEGRVAANPEAEDKQERVSPEQRVAPTTRAAVTNREESEGNQKAPPQVSKARPRDQGRVAAPTAAEEQEEVQQKAPVRRKGEGAAAAPPRTLGKTYGNAQEDAEEVQEELGEAQPQTAERFQVLARNRRTRQHEHRDAVVYEDGDPGWDEVPPQAQPRRQGQAKVADPAAREAAPAAQRPVTERSAPQRPANAAPSNPRATAPPLGRGEQNQPYVVDRQASPSPPPQRAARSPPQGTVATKKERRIEDPDMIDSEQVQLFEEPTQAPQRGDKKRGVAKVSPGEQEQAPRLRLGDVKERQKSPAETQAQRELEPAVLTRAVRRR